MKVENLAQATKLVADLEMVQHRLNLCVKNREKFLKDKKISDNFFIGVDAQYLYLDDTPTIAHEILEILIAKYSMLKENLTKQIETL